MTNVVVLDPPGVAQAVESCWSPATASGGDRTDGRGLLNLKRLLGRPVQFRLVIEELARSIQPDVAVAACDKGAWPLLGALVVRLGVPGILVRPDPKAHRVEYGDDPALADPRLAGERLAPGTTVHLVDDVVHSGATLASAGSAVRSAGLTVSQASVVVGFGDADAVSRLAGAAGLTRVTCLVMASTLNLPPPG